MKSLINIAMAIISVITLFSCAAGVPITAQKAVNNSTYEVDYLFEHDGCKVYRFLDNHEYVYFTNCTGVVSSTKGDSTKTKTVNMVNSGQVR